MIQQFKTHIWGYIEYHTSALYHATDTVLHRLDRLQKHFLEEIDITEQVAFLDYNFAPLGLRRDIGVLGFLHKRVLNECHPAVREFLLLDEPANAWHDKQIYTYMERCTTRHALYERSLFGAINVYNRLMPYLVDLPTVSKFQRELTWLAKLRCQRGDSDWKYAFKSTSQAWRTRLALDQ